MVSLFGGRIMVVVVVWRYRVSAALIGIVVTIQHIECLAVRGEKGKKDEKRELLGISSCLIGEFQRDLIS